MDVGLGLDLSRGAVRGEPTVISWTSPAPYAAIAVPASGLSRLVFRGRYTALAGRFLGVTATDYYPVVITDPGPDDILGSFDNRNLTVYAQNPASLGQDRYLLTNPTGLRELNEVLTATAATRHQYVELRLSFTAEKSWGATNPGSSIWVNDPDLVGALYRDPNSLINATGHPFVYRAFLGKIQAVFSRSPPAGGLRVYSCTELFGWASLCARVTRDWLAARTFPGRHHDSRQPGRRQSRAICSQLEPASEARICAAVRQLGTYSRSLERTEQRQHDTPERSDRSAIQSTHCGRERAAPNRQARFSLAILKKKCVAPAPAASRSG